jgi:hypothetical protein
MLRSGVSGLRNNDRVADLDGLGNLLLIGSDGCGDRPHVEFIALQCQLDHIDGKTLPMRSSPAFCACALW